MFLATLRCPYFTPSYRERLLEASAVVNNIIGRNNEVEVFEVNRFYGMPIGLQLLSELQNGIPDLFIKRRAFQGFLKIGDPERFGRQRSKIAVCINPVAGRPCCRSRQGSAITSVPGLHREHCWRKCLFDRKKRHRQ